MTNSTQALDYEIIPSRIDGDFAVWTPDQTGGIIGIGKTREEAIVNAIASMGSTIAEMAELITDPQKDDQ